ncbi:TnsA endonuclease N-terminal domain-containing protein [Burkholderia contaminans]|uniref:TnsA endonuclease N-terminal domain-containing protein n=2 Tax=Burkholderia contaminans TaxID=488447 RepID=UPI0032EA7601
MEVAPSVKSIATQPQVFEYLDGTCRRRYTPDLKIETTVGAIFLEVKDDRSITKHSQATVRVSSAARHFRQRGVRFHLVLRSDLVSNNLQRQLELLLRARPMPGRYRPNIDSTLWDPEHGAHPPAEVQQQWESAKRECDALLQRIMKRELISIALVTEDGREFYGERDDFDRRTCSPFVHEAVLPQLGQYPDRVFSRENLRPALCEWLRPFECGIFCMDFPGDWDLLVDILDGVPNGWQGLLVRDQADQVRLESYYKQFGGRHHALHDARALRYAMQDGRPSIHPTKSSSD